MRRTGWKGALEYQKKMLSLLVLSVVVGWISVGVIMGLGPMDGFFGLLRTVVIIDVIILTVVLPLFFLHTALAFRNYIKCNCGMVLSPRRNVCGRCGEKNPYLR